MALQDLFQCDSNNEFSVITSSYVVIEDKVKLYDNTVKNKVDLLKSKILNITNYFDQKSSLTSTQSTYLTRAKDFYDYLNQPKFNTLVSVQLNYMDAFKQSTFEFQSSYLEYYMMAKQSERYHCCLIEGYRSAIRIFGSWITTGKIMCGYDNTVKAFIDEIDRITDYIENNEITQNMTYDEVFNQRLKNASEKKSDFIGKENIMYSSIASLNYDMQDLAFRLESVLQDIKLSIKVVGICNIIFTADDQDLSLLSSMSTQVASYSEQIDFNDPNNTESYGDLYYRLRERVIASYVPPIVLDFRKYLKPDWSNFNQLISQAIVISLASAGLLINCGVLKKLGT